MQAVSTRRLPAMPPRHGYRPPITILTRYVLREIGGPALLALALILFVAVAKELQERRSALPLEYITWWDVTRLIVYFSPTLISYVVPITYLMGILLAFGRLAQSNEITAMKAAGIPLKRLTLPVILCGALLSVGCFLLQERVQPEAMRRANELIYGELLERVTLDVLPAGVMHEIGGMRIFFEDRDSASKTLRGVVLVQPKTGGDRVFYADEAQFVDSPDGAILVLRRGQIVYPLEGDNVAATQFTERRESIQSAARRFAPSQRKAMTFSELLEKERAAVARHTASPSRQNAENLRLTRAEIGERVSLPLACLAVSIVAAPFAARARPAAAGGRSYSFAIGFIIVGAYYLIRLFVEADDVRPLAECVLRGMTPNFALAVVGIAALWRVDRV